MYTSQMQRDREDRQGQCWCRHPKQLEAGDWGIHRHRLFPLREGQAYFNITAIQRTRPLLLGSSLISENAVGHIIFGLDTLHTVPDNLGICDYYSASGRIFWWAQGPQMWRDAPICGEIGVVALGCRHRASRGDVGPSRRRSHKHGRLSPVARRRPVFLETILSSEGLIQSLLPSSMSSPPRSDEGRCDFSPPRILV